MARRIIDVMLHLYRSYRDRDNGDTTVDDDFVVDIVWGIALLMSFFLEKLLASAVFNILCNDNRFKSIVLYISLPIIILAIFKKCNFHNLI